MKEHRNSLNAVQALKTPLPLHRIVIEIYEKNFCSTITNQKETLHNIHQSEEKWYDFLLAPDSAFLNTLPSHFSCPKNCDTRFHKVFIRSRNLVSFCLNDFLSVLFVSASKSLISSKFWVCSYRRGSPSKGSESNASIKWKFQHLPGYTPGHLNFWKLIYSNPPPLPSQDGVQMSYSSAGFNSKFFNTRQNRRP